MSRLFSVNFPFRQRDCFALVSIRERGADLHCQVRFADPQWNNLIGGKCFVFSPVDGIKQPSGVSDDLTQSLLASTAQAIQKHLGGHRASN